jgi:hypothetical protein
MRVTFEGEAGACRAAGLRQGAGRRRARAERARDRRRRRPASRVDERGFMPSTADAHQRAAHLRDRRHRRAADAGAQGDHEGKVAAEVAAGEKSFFDARVIPSVAYTDPEVAWVGLTETEAKAQGIALRKGCSRGRRAAARSRWPRRRVHEAAVRPGDGRVLGGGIVGTERRRPDRRGRRLRSRWAATPPISAHDPPPSDAVRDGRHSPPRPSRAR